MKINAGLLYTIYIILPLKSIHQMHSFNLFFEIYREITDDIRRHGQKLPPLSSLSILGPHFLLENGDKPSLNKEVLQNFQVFGWSKFK
jgi:hypothetical protein